VLISMIACRGRRYARIRNIRANRPTLDAKGAQEFRAGESWAASLSNHREAIDEMEFFSAPIMRRGDEKRQHRLCSS
jgi:hypothetical protein